MTETTMPVAGIRPAADVTSEAQLVIRNARIYTGDPANPSASAAAIADGRFIAVGDDATIARHVGPSTRIIDALGRRAIPGLNDSHTHVIRGGNNYFLELRWDGVPSLAIALRMLKRQAQRTPPGQWVRVVGGWTADQFVEKRMPTLEELNRAAPDTPVFVLHLYQSALMNRAALDAVGFDRTTADPPGGEIVRDWSGTPTGLLLAAPAAGLLYATLAKGPVLDQEQKVESTRHFFRELNRFGLTSAIDAAGGFQDFPGDYSTVMRLAEKGELTIRIAYHLFPQTAGQELDDLRRWIGMIKPGDGDEWLRANGAGENLAWSPADFENFAEPRPKLRVDAPSELEAAARLLVENGWGFRLHATYDETIQHDLDVFERIAADHGGSLGVPWFLDHAETISPRSIERLAALGGNISIQDRMVFQGRAFRERYGDEATAWAPPTTRLLEAGLIVGAGTDATRVSSYNPWRSLEWLVTRRDIAGVDLSDGANTVSREQALQMYTVAGASLSGEDEVKGRVRVGQYADLVLLDADYFTVPAEQIHTIEADLTVAGGKIVYASDAYAGQERPLPPISLRWSPVAHYGGAWPAGVTQAASIVEAAADSAEQTRWRETRGEQPAHVADGC